MYCYENLPRCGNEPSMGIPEFPTIIKYDVLSKNKIKIITKDVSEVKEENNKYVPAKYNKTVFYFKVKELNNRLIFKKEI